MGRHLRRKDLANSLRWRFKSLQMHHLDKKLTTFLKSMVETLHERG